jgi:hypothetical protein
MSQNINQIFIANPITSNASTDLMYFGQSPYGIGNDAGMTYANFSAQFGAAYTASALTSSNDTNITISLGGSPTTALLHATSLTMGWSGTLSGTRGGTGVNNGASTITLGGSLITSGAFASTFTMTGTTNVTFPTSGTLATTTQIPTGAALTAGNDTNVTLSLGGSPTNALLNAASVTAGWTGQLSVARGGTGDASFTAYAPICGGTTTTGNLQSTTLGNSGTLMQSAGTSTLPGFTTATYPSAASGTGTVLRANGTNWVASTSTFSDTYTASNILYSNGANTVTGLATANSAVVVTSSAGVPVLSSTMTNGQLIIGSTGATPTAATITAGTGISITNGAGTISIASSGVGSLTWNDVSGTSQAATINNGYIISNAGQTTVTLPATAVVGSVFAVQGKGAAGWILKMNTGQICHFGNAATTSAGTLTSTNQWDSVAIVCVTADTNFAVTTAVGNLTVA